MNPSLVTGQFNDSFIPIADGVAVVVRNYCHWLNLTLGPSYAITPRFPGFVDSFEFPVLRYLSVPMPVRPPYRCGLPIVDPSFLSHVSSIPFGLVHAHCPFTSGLVALVIARARNIPIVATFHTRYGDDLKGLGASDGVTRLLLKRIADFYRAVDQVWVPNWATSEVLRAYGYRGDCEVVPNGTDIEISQAERDGYRHELESELSLSPGDVVFLYVGQHRWEKNLRLLIESLRRVKDAGRSFRMIFAGQGYAQEGMRRLVDDLGLRDQVTFLGVVHDRERLKRYYAGADLLLFPSLYDTFSLVVREAAACYLPALLIRGSAAAEGVVDGRNGFLAACSVESYAQALLYLMEHPAAVRGAGEAARHSLYRSWEDILAEVRQRYLDLASCRGKARLFLARHANRL